MVPGGSKTDTGRLDSSCVVDFVHPVIELGVVTRTDQEVLSVARHETEHVRVFGIGFVIDAYSVGEGDNLDGS